MPRSHAEGKTSCLERFFYIDPVFFHPVPNGYAIDPENAGCFGLVAACLPQPLDGI